LLSPIFDPIPHKELPFVVAPVGLELLAIQAPYQLLGKLVVDAGVFEFVVGNDHHFLDRTPIDHEMHLVASASLRTGKTVPEVAEYSKRPLGRRESTR
jgi:hypothetical protein